MRLWLLSAACITSAGLTLLKANNLKTAQLSQGLRLKIPSTSTKYVLPKDGQSLEERLAKADNNNKQRQVVQHTLKSGDTLETIAKQYQVPARNILQWNKISSLSIVKKGQQITLHLDRPTPEAAAVTAKFSQAVVKIAAELKQTAQVPYSGCDQETERDQVST